MIFKYFLPFSLFLLKKYRFLFIDFFNLKKRVIKKEDNHELKLDVCTDKNYVEFSSREVIF